MKLTIAPDTWERAEAGILPLIPQYSAEVHGDAQRACLHRATYAAQDACGHLVLHVVRARTTIVGFLAALVLPHHQYVPSLWGFVDLWYVLPDYRRCGAPGLALLRHALQDLQARGCQVIQAGSPSSPTIARILCRVGFSLESQMFCKKV